MSNENKNLQSDLNDFPDEDFADIQLMGDTANFDEEAIERALRNIAAQMAGASDDIKELHQEALNSLSKANNALPTEEELFAESLNQEFINETELTDEEILKSDNYIKEKPIDEEAIDSVSDKEEITENIENMDSEISQNNLSNVPLEDTSIFYKNSEQNNEEISTSSDNELIENADDKNISEAAEDTDIKDNTDKQEDISNREINKWEEIDDDNNVVKKYIVYISKDFIPVIDNLSVDQRSAYINDAIQIKIDAQDIKKQNIEKRNAIIHFAIALIVIILFTPIALIITNKSIMATFDNYKYSQENFEKLYQQRFEKDRAYMRSLEYNRELEKRTKKQNDNKAK